MGPVRASRPIGRSMQSRIPRVSGTRYNSPVFQPIDVPSLLSSLTRERLAEVGRGLGGPCLVRPRIIFRSSWCRKRLSSRHGSTGFTATRRRRPGEAASCGASFAPPLSRLKLNCVMVRTLPDEKLKVPAAVEVPRFVITGDAHHRLHEKLSEVGGHLLEVGLKREMGFIILSAWHDSAAPVPFDDWLFDALRPTRMRRSVARLRSLMLPRPSRRLQRPRPPLLRSRPLERGRHE